jgi:phosphate transport system substrate-binding protein
MFVKRILLGRFPALALGLLLAIVLQSGESLLGRSSAGAVELHGAGATFPAPLYQAWIDRFQKDHPDVSIRYEPIGSGEGFARFASGVVDFAGSDSPIPTNGAGRFERIGAQVPATAGMIVLAYNLPGVTGLLKLPRAVYVDIFLGKIRSWDDPRITAANPDLTLPSMDIAVIGRLDSSGTTYAFSSHLAAASPMMSQDGPGVGKIVAWPNAAMLARGNEGVASRIKISQGAIGYVEYGLAGRLGLPMASLENKEGRFVAPTLESGLAAIHASAHLGLDNLASSVVDPTGADAYPIVTYSWLILPKTYPADQGRALRSFMDFTLGDGQGMSKELGYIPLPSEVSERGKAVIANILPGDGASTPASTATEQANTAPATAPPSLSPAPASPTRAEIYTVAPGDTFKSIAVKLYRDSRRWRAIAAANPKIDPRRPLRAGQILKLPEPVEAMGRPL